MVKDAYTGGRTTKALTPHNENFQTDLQKTLFNGLFIIQMCYENKTQLNQTFNKFIGCIQISLAKYMKHDTLGCG